MLEHLKDIKEETQDVRIEGIIECLSPLSHIGETHSVGSFFNTEEILTKDGWAKVPTYTGNAFRGMLRRESRNYLCNTLNISLNEDWFAKLSYGAGTSETMIIDVQKRKLERKFFPMLSIFGYGLGSMGGKLSPMPLRLICKENKNLIPAKYHSEELYEANEHIGNEAFTRMDEFKNDKALDNYFLDNKIETDKDGKRLLKQGESTAQMRYETEIVKTGSKWYCRFDLQNVTNTEIGCFISALSEWGKYSRLGGMHNKGYGLVKANLDFTNINTEENITDFMFITDNIENLSEKASEYKRQYDVFLKDVVMPMIERYEGFLKDNSMDIMKLLSEGDKK